MAGAGKIARVPRSVDLRVRRDLRALANLPSVGQILTGTYASIPKPGNVGTVFLASDGFGLFWDNGTTWDLYTSFGAGLNKASVLAQADYSWINQASATVGSVGSATQLKAGTGPFSLYTKTISAGSWAIAAPLCTIINPSQNIAGSGLCISDGTKFIWFGYQQDSTNVATNLRCEKWTDVNTISASVSFGAQTQLLASSFVPAATWLRIDDDGATTRFMASADGTTFLGLTSIAHNNFLTATKYGFFLRSGTSTNVWLTIPAVREGF